MTVDELIARLKTYPPAMPVCVQGYEDGYSDILQPEPMQLVADYYAEWYYGPHAEARHTDLQANMMALVLRRAPNPNAKRE